MSLSSAADLFSGFSDVRLWTFVSVLVKKEHWTHRKQRSSKVSVPVLLLEKI